MPTFKSEQEIKNYILSKASIAVQSTNITVADDMSQAIGNFYSEWTPEYYDRTYQLYNSIYSIDVEKSGNGCYAYSGYDQDAMSHKCGSTYNEYRILSNTMEGNHGDAYQGENLWINLIVDLKDEVYDRLKGHMRANGLPIK